LLGETGVRIAGIDWWLKETAGAPVLHVRGDVDLVTAPEFARAIRAAAAHTDQPVVIDLTQVDFMDGRGLRILEDASRDALLTVRPSKLVRRLLEVVRLERIIMLD
jgi:anti-anti-sigma factor